MTHCFRGRNIITRSSQSLVYTKKTIRQDPPLNLDTHNNELGRAMYVGDFEYAEWVADLGGNSNIKMTCEKNIRSLRKVKPIHNSAAVDRDTYRRRLA